MPMGRNPPQAPEIMRGRGGTLQCYVPAVSSIERVDLRSGEHQNSGNSDGSGPPSALG